MGVYTYTYSDTIADFQHWTMSLHRTKAGAYKAMKAYVYELYAEWEEDRRLNGKGSWNDKFAVFKSWGVRSIEVRE